jgi:hypothetical protein
VLPVAASCAARSVGELLRANPRTPDASNPRLPVFQSDGQQADAAFKHLGWKPVSKRTVTPKTQTKHKGRRYTMANDTEAKSGRGSDSDRLSQSPLSIRRGGADPTDIGAGEVQTNTGDFGYDANPVTPRGTDQWAPPGSREKAP